MLKGPSLQFGKPGSPLAWLRPYKPVMVGKLLDIFRVFYNFVEVEKNKQTPAMRLGLAKGKIMIEDIIYYK
jgi:hypothetical protein